MEMTRLSSKTGRQVMPLFVALPDAAAGGRDEDGLGRAGDAATSESRPMKLAGPTLRQRMPAMVAESTDWAADSAGSAEQRKAGGEWGAQAPERSQWMHREGGRGTGET